MEKIELSETEIAKLKANRETVNNLQRQMKQISQQIQQHQNSQDEILNDIKERANVDSIDEVDFSQIDWANFEGSAMIHEDDNDGNR